jgi:hypothetical protein
MHPRDFVKRIIGNRVLVLCKSWQDDAEVGAEVTRTERCNQCGQELVEIDNHGEQLVGCLTCNLWAAPEGRTWIRLNEEDLRSLHQLRHGGSR